MTQEILFTVCIPARAHAETVLLTCVGTYFFLVGFNLLRLLKALIIHFAIKKKCVIRRFRIKKVLPEVQHKKIGHKISNLFEFVVKQIAFNRENVLVNFN